MLIWVEDLFAEREGVTHADIATQARWQIWRTMWEWSYRFYYTSTTDDLTANSEPKYLLSNANLQKRRLEFPFKLLEELDGRNIKASARLMTFVRDREVFEDVRERYESEQGAVEASITASGGVGRLSADEVRVLKRQAEELSECIGFVDEMLVYLR